MEHFFGVSYPTIKSRLNRIGALMPFPEVDPQPESNRQTARSTDELLSQLERGELTVDEVIRQLRKEEQK